MDNQLLTLTQEIFLILYKNSPSQLEYCFREAQKAAKAYIELQDKHLK